MDGLTFTSEMVKALAWPLSALAIALVFRPQLQQVLRLLTRVRYGEFEFEFERQVSKLTVAAKALPKVTDSVAGAERERLLRLAAESPKIAVVEAWRMVENRLVDVGHQHQLKFAPTVWAMPMVLTAMLHHEKVLTEAQSDLIPSLKALRDDVTHSKNTKVTMDEALRYVELSLQLVASIPDKVPPQSGTVS